MGKALFQLHVRGYLIKRHVPRPFHHNLHAGIPRALHELSYLDELGHLPRIGGVVG